MVDGAFCGNCGTPIAVDDRFCGDCGASQEVYATTSGGNEVASADCGEDVQSTTGVDRPVARTEPVPGDDRTAREPSLGFWDAAGIAMELLVRGVYVVLCGGVAILAFQNGEPLIGAGAIAYGLYILGGGQWFIS